MGPVAKPETQRVPINGRAADFDGDGKDDYSGQAGGPGYFCVAPV